METIKYLVVILIFSGLVLCSCDKNDEEPTDFRDKYIGKYQVHETISGYSYSSGVSPSKEKDTIISVLYGSTDSTLKVLGRDVYLDSTGFYSAYHYSLRLWNDSIYSYDMNGGLGAGQKEIYVGYRISNTP